MYAFIKQYKNKDDIKMTTNVSKIGCLKYFSKLLNNDNKSLNEKKNNFKI